MYANIVFPIASFRFFIYKIPSNLQGKLHYGCAVNVPFKNKLTIGYIESIVKDPSYSGKIHTIKSIDKNQSISKDLWQTIVWMSNYYIAPLGLCIKSAIPSLTFNPENIKKDLYLEINNNQLQLIKKYKFSKNQQIVINELLNSREPLPAKYFTYLIYA